MYLRRLSLTNFRCYPRLQLTLPCETVVLSGSNAQGKTTLLEAVYVLATTRAPYAVPDRQLLRWQALDDEVLPFSRVRGEVAKAGGDVSIEVVTVRQDGNGQGSRYVKRAKVDDIPRRAMDVVGQLQVVLFTPRDMEIVAGPPSERRRYLDVLLCQIDRPYCQALARYRRLVGQRNHLLRRLRDEGGGNAELSVWDQRLATDGGRLLASRLRAVARLRDLTDEIHRDLCADPLQLDYHATVDLDGIDPATAEPDELEARMLQALADRRGEERARGQTVVGPHRDDLTLLVRGVDMRTYGSRGQQRTVTLAIKLGEARLMWSVGGERPVLLLDDVLGELDADRRRHLLSHVDAHQQTLITTTEPDALPPGFAADALMLHIEGGAITAATRGDTPITPPVATFEY